MGRSGGKMLISRLWSWCEIYVGSYSSLIYIIIKYIVVSCGSSRAYCCTPWMSKIMNDEEMQMQVEVKSRLDATCAILKLM